MSLSKYISVALASSLKFVGGPLAGLAWNLPWLETALCSIVGAMLTILLTASIGQKILVWWQGRQKVKPNRFSKRTRMAIRIYRRFGIVGIACLTPIFFTPIGGTLIAISFKIPLSKILLNMLIFCVLWGFSITWAVYQFRELFN
jgi:hypothetical protein